MLKFTFILFIFFVHTSLCEISFTVVLDTTVSMKDEINVIKANIGQVVYFVNRTDLGNFVLVPFKDTAVEAPFTTSSAREFTSRIHSITTSGGNDCPENSLAGIEAGLRASEKQSLIFVFTDAYAKDFEKFGALESLCKESHSQVIIFLSGFCLSSRAERIGNEEVYYDIAKACSGAVFRFDTMVDLRQVFRYMRDFTNTEWTDLTHHEKFAEYKQFSISVGSFTTDFMMVVLGNNPAIEVVGATHTMFEKVLDTKHSLVARLTKLEVGDYIVNIRGQGSVSVIFYEKNAMPFEFGFSTKSPRSIKETSLRPIAGWTNYILITVDSSIKLHAVEWLNLGENVKNVLLLKQIACGTYVASAFVEPGKLFKFWVYGSSLFLAMYRKVYCAFVDLEKAYDRVMMRSEVSSKTYTLYGDIRQPDSSAEIAPRGFQITGQDTATQHEIKASSKILAPQMSVSNSSWTKPEAEIIDSDLNLIDFGSALTLACRVNGYPKPNIVWEDEKENVLPSEDILLEIPSVYISYATISNVTKNSTIYCKCENTQGDGYHSIDVFVNRTLTFDVVQAPEDATVEYGTEHKLFCQVDAYPEATIAWFLNSSSIDAYSSRLIIEENALIIKNMSFEDVGDYECRAKNDVEQKTFTAIVDITGIEAPEIENTGLDIVLKPGDEAEIECRIKKGKPLPTITWKFKHFDDYNEVTLPDDVLVEDGKVKISSVKKNHQGIYRCIASNDVGDNSKDFSIKIQYAPIIKSSNADRVTVAEGSDVKLFCDVDAIPKATVRWEMSQDDVIIAFDYRHRTDESHTHYFTALESDSGNYHCIVENSIGRAETTVAVNVLVPPYIETPKTETLQVNVGASVVLECHVLYGNPAPRTKWEFIALDSQSTILSRGNSTNALHLNKVSRSDEGSYMCIAENQISSDRIKYHLKVQ